MEQEHPDIKKFQRLLDRYLAGEATAEEIAQLNAVYERFQQLEPDHLPDRVRMLRQKQLQRLMKSVSTMDDMHSDDNSPPESFLQKSRRHRVRIAMAAMAAGLAIFAISEVDLQKNVHMSGEIIEVLAIKGEQRVLMLPDGTQVRLNANSRLSYPARFEKGNRVVELFGEAYFDVVKDPKAPFIIKTDKMDVQVLGTTLNVRAYPDDDRAETSLLTGSVKIFSKFDPAKIVVLEPNQRYVIHHGQSEFVTQDPDRTQASENIAPYVTEYHVVDLSIGTEADVPKEIEWIHRRLTIRDEPLSEVVVELERWYNVEFRIENPEVAQQRYSAKFENENLDTLLKALQLVMPFNYRKEADGTIIIY